MKYESPRITDFGSIAKHTFITPGGHTKDHIVCELDPMFGEYSCGEEGS
jgi:hypothetical protein